MASSSRINGSIRRDLYVLEDENNPKSSQAENVLPSTVIDQVYDDESPSKKNLRQILDELRQEIITGGRGNIVFPVTSVNGMTDDVYLTKKHIGLGNVDNTKDNDKPMSVPQRSAVMEILHNYDFKINLDELYEHMMNTENPHDVTLEQINRDEALSKFIKYYIGLHNTSQNSTVHADIRNSLRRLWVLVDGINNNVDNKTDRMIGELDDHISDDMAHINILEKKENTFNKVMDFITPANVTHVKYPSTRAVVEYVANKLSEFEKTLPGLDYWIEDIKVVDSRTDLPTPSVNSLHKAYFIRIGNGIHSEIALCRMNPNGSYSWDISDTGSVSKFDNRYFSNTTNGLSVNMSSVVDAILDDHGALDTSLSEALQDYYTITQIDEFKYINNIKMLPGTDDGTIRFYTNDDLTSMSDDIPVAGLRRLAYLENVSEDQISDNSIFERHIVHKAIATKHIQDRAVKPTNIYCPHGSIVGNDKDSVDPTANTITLEKLAEYLRPLIGGWPDPTVPGGNPWYDKLSIQLMQTHKWISGVEYPFGNGGYGIRFTGTISCLPNTNHKLKISENITTSSGFKMMDAGGSWMYQSSPDIEWTVIGGSNITGHTFATVTMDKKGLYFESISIGDRIDAPFDIWVKYIKTDEIDKYPEIPPNEY